MIPIKITFSVLFNFLLPATIILPNTIALKTIAIITKGRYSIPKSDDFIERTATVRVRITNTDTKIISGFFKHFNSHSFH